MYQLIYQSACRTGTTIDVLRTIARQSAPRNRDRGVTGVMLVHGNKVVQILEGEERDVRALYHTISRDRRHGGCTILLTCEGGERVFPDWSMGVCEVEDTDTDMFRLAVATIKARQRQKESLRIAEVQRRRAG